MQQITNITPEQEARFDEYVQRGLKMGLSTEPADFERAERAVRRTYELIELPVPTILRARSPIEALRLGQEFVAARGGTFSPTSYREGQFWAPWVVYIQYIRDVLGVDELGVDDSILRDFEQTQEALAESCGWVFWHEDVAVISDRMERYVWEGDYIPSCRTGPAIRYRDGTEFYIVDNVDIPPEWIKTPEVLTPSLVLGWTNIEQRRIAASLLGWQNILPAIGAKTVATDKWGELVEATLDGELTRFVRVVCATGREFVLVTDNDVKTPLEAVALSYGVAPEVYARLEVRT